MPFDDRSSNLDLNGPNIEIKTDAYGHAPGSTSSKTVVNPFGDDQGRTGGTIEITGVGTATWPVGFETYASNTGTIGYQWHELGTGPLGVSTRYEGETTDSVVLIRDFTDYPYKYFPLTDLAGDGLFNAVCVKECPSQTYTAAKTEGNCVIDSIPESFTTPGGGTAGGEGVEGVDYSVYPDYKDSETCGKLCLADSSC